MRIAYTPSTGQKYLFGSLREVRRIAVEEVGHVRVFFGLGDSQLGEIVARTRSLEYDKAARYGREGLAVERTRDEIGIHAIRGGDIVGEHTLHFASTGERIELTHRAGTFSRKAPYERRSGWLEKRQDGTTCKICWDSAKTFATVKVDAESSVLMRCGIALGSNIEDRLAHLRDGFRRACSFHEPGPPVAVSSIYETDPVDCEPGTSPYLNAVIEINFSGPPVALLDRLLEIEQAMGRPSKRPRNSPRTIDLDVLYAGNFVLNNPEIIIPHPRLHKRRFVLAPLAEIAPDLVLPGYLRPIKLLLAELQDASEGNMAGSRFLVREKDHPRHNP